MSSAATHPSHEQQLLLQLLHQTTPQHAAARIATLLNWYISQDRTCVLASV
jgi:hypothetical protein